MWQVEVTQTNTITQEVAQFQSCAVPQLVPLLEQVFRGADQTADAVNLFRNEMVEGNNALLGTIGAKRISQ